MGTVRRSRFFVSEREFCGAYPHLASPDLTAVPGEARGCKGDLHLLREQLQVLDAEAVNLLKQKKGREWPVESVDCQPQSSTENKPVKQQCSVDTFSTIV